MCMRCYSLEVLMQIISMIVMNHSKMYVANVDGNKYDIVSLISLHDVQTVALIYIIIYTYTNIQKKNHSDVTYMYIVRMYHTYTIIVVT